MSSAKSKTTKGSKRGGKDQESKRSKKQGKSRKEKDREEDQSESEIDERVEKETKVRAGADQTDIEAMKAIVSINTIDLLPLKFGKWNSRPLDVSKGQQLLTSMKNQEFRMFKMESMIPLIMKKGDIEEEAIKTDIADGLGAEAPELRLTEQGKKKAQLDAAGGRHRHWAIAKEVGEGKKEIARLNDAIAELEAKGGDKNQNLMEDKKKEIEQLEAYHKTISKWGVIIYDEEKMLANGEALANHISRNEFEFRYVEREAEGLRMELREYINTEGDEEKRKRYLKKVGSESSVVGQIMNHRETRNYLMALNSLGEHFHHREVFDSKWIKENLHAIGGGIVMNIVDYLVRIWKALLTSEALIEMDETQLKDYHRELMNPTEQQTTNLLSASRRTWKIMTRDDGGLNTTSDDQSGDAKKPLIHLLTDDLMDGLTDLGVGGNELHLLIGGDDADWAVKWAEYTLGVEDLVRTFMERVLKKSEEKEVRDMLERKVDWILTDHNSFHYQRRLPLLTPAVIVGYGQAMKMIPNALTEFLRWFDPFAEYLMTNSRSPDRAKDLSCWVLRTIATYHGKLFKDGALAARELAHFVVCHLDVFILMEDEIKLISIPSRPKTSQESTTAKLTAKYGNKIPFSDNDRKALFKTMQAVKKGQVSVDPYINMKSCVDWRLIPSKKLDRDWARHILAIILEPVLVSHYREKLLMDSPVASYLRAMARTLLSAHCRRSENIGPHSVPGYVFVDGIHLTNVVTSKPMVNVERVIEKRDQESQMEHMNQELQGFIKRFEKLKGIAAKPGTDLVADDVKNTFDGLVKKMLFNTYRLDAMNKVSNPKSINPLDSQWHHFEIVESLDHVMRRNGWSKGKAKTAKKSKKAKHRHSTDEESDSSSDHTSVVESEDESDPSATPAKPSSAAAMPPASQSSANPKVISHPDIAPILTLTPESSLFSNTTTSLTFNDVPNLGQSSSSTMADMDFNLSPEESPFPIDSSWISLGSKRPAPDTDLEGAESRPANRARSSNHIPDAEEREVIRPQRTATARAKGVDLKGKRKAG